MTTANKVSLPAGGPERQGPHFIHHPSFQDPGAEKLYGGNDLPEHDASLGFLPDEATRDCSRRMHYAAWRADTARTRREAARWERRYYACRDRVVLGNRKLIYRAVRKWSPPFQLADDLAGECQVVLIKVVAAYNPWLGIRFSTYAFTCLMRALSRLSQRRAADRLSHWLPLEALPDGEPLFPVGDGEPNGALFATLDEYLRADHTLLTPREKLVLIRRYHLHEDGPRTDTLEQVGHDLGLSKERVRQVQMSALGKLREALLTRTPAS